MRAWSWSSVALLVGVGCGSAAPVDGGPVDASVVDAARDASVAGDAGVDAAEPGADAGNGDAGARPEGGRVGGVAVVAWVATTADGALLLEERLAPIPAAEGDRDPGPRALVSLAGGDRAVVWAPEPSDRLLDAVAHPSGAWTAVGVGPDRRLFIARGGAGPVRRVDFDDPTLHEEPAAWQGEPPTALRVPGLGEGGPRLVADGEDAVLVVMNDHNAVLAYRLRPSGDRLESVHRTLVTPAAGLTPFLPIGGSYDNFDAMWSWFLPVAALDEQGRTFVAVFLNHTRVAAHNARFGTSHRLLQSSVSAGDRPSDVLVVRIGRDGAHELSRVLGTPDVDDELYAVATGAGRVAVVGRSRRERGVDNTEWHVMVAQMELEGEVLGVTTFDAIDSAIAQAASFDEAGALWVGGTEAWRQNPSGFSLFDEGQPFLLRITGAPAAPVVEREDGRLPPTTGHAELRALASDEGQLWIGGLENGPLTHTGDADPSRVRADGWWARRALAP